MGSICYLPMITSARRRSEWGHPTPPASSPPDQLGSVDDGSNWSERSGAGHKDEMEKVADFFLPRGVVAQKLSGRMFAILWERCPSDGLYVLPRQKERPRRG